MGAKRKDLTGQRFGRLVVIRDAGTVRVGKKQETKRVWFCHCDCGVEGTFYQSALAAGLTTSCGCRRREATAERRTTHGHSQGRKVTRAYRAWACMLTRVRNPNINNANRYSGRGITVCPEWEAFENFLRDMGEPPPRRSLDRIDNDGNYEPGNCRWATTLEQARNKSHGVRRSSPAASPSDPAP